MDYYDSSSYDPNLAYHGTQAAANSDPVAAAVAVMIVFFIAFVFWVAAYAVSAFLLSRIFKKAGTPQWAAWVPIYNVWKLLELGGRQGFWAVIALIPFVGIISLVFIYIAMYHIGKKLGKEDWFILLAIFLPVIWMIWLGFDDSKWEGGKKDAKPAKKVSTKASA